jgi:PBSX family phage terminase large subunit
MTKIYINPIYRLRIWDCTDSRVILFGGAGSGKSEFAKQWILLKYFLSQPDKKRPERLLFVRKVAKTIKQSIWVPTVRILADLGISADLKTNETDKTIKDTVSGNEIIMVGMDNEDKIKSIDGITKVFVDEADQLTEQDLLQLELRMRGNFGGFFQMILCFNPVDERHFLVRHTEPQYLPKDQQPQNIVELEYLNTAKTCWRFANADSEGNKSYTTVLNTNYKHNLKLDPIYKTRLKLLASVDKVYYQVYEAGRWGVADGGNRYAYNFQEAVHVRNVEYTPNETLHYTLDFNVSPHMTGLVAQIKYINNRYQVYIFKQYALKHPENEAFRLGANFVGDFDDVMRFGICLYGDASGNNRLGVSDTKTLFQDVLKGFGKWGDFVEKRVPTANPRYDKIATGAMGRKTFLNAILSGKLPIDLYINPECSELIADLRQCTQDANGKLAKPKNSKGYEERGHALQALEYLLCHPKFTGELAIL